LIDLVASEPHYRDHLLPIWNALPAELRGIDWGGGPAERNGHVLMVAGYSDVKRHPHHPVVYVEHGAGQSYIDLDIAVRPFYSGGGQHRNVIGYVCPNDEVAGRWQSRYPDKPTAVVGCPRLDPWHAGDRGECDPRTVAITFHWDAQFTGVPETASAFGYYLPHMVGIIERLRNKGWTILAHAHPRHTALANFWRQPEIKDLGATFVESSDGVLDRAGVLIADNTSVQAEFLSLGRPVVWLNHPSYRRDVSHGGRFWQWPTLGGAQVDTGAELLALDLSQLPPVTGHPYAYADGRASQRAAQFVAELVT